MTISIPPFNPHTMIHAHAPLQRPGLVQTPLIGACGTPCPDVSGTPCSGRCECTGCPPSSQGWVTPHPQGASLRMPLWQLWVSWGQWLRAEAHGGAVLPGPGRAPAAMGPHLAGSHQHHCCPAPLFSYLLQILLFLLCICLDYFFAIILLILQLLLN